MKSASRDSKGMYGFDPRGLERAAKAAKLLDSSPNAKQAFDLAMKEEETEYLKEQNKLRSIELQQEKFQYENRKNLITMEIESNKQKALYEDYLAKQRIDYQLKKQKETEADILSKQESSINNQEAEKRATLDHEHNLQVIRDRLKIQNKYTLKAKVDRENYDITKEKQKQKSIEERETKIQLRRLTLNSIGNGVKAFMSDKTMFHKFIFGISSAFLLSYAVKKGINLSYDIISNKLFIPKLIKETSRFDIKQIVSLSFFRRIMNKNKLFDGLFFNPELHKKLNSISLSMMNRRKSNLPYRNFLFYGPPGTGKTTFAKNLAIKSRIDYAILTGADISPLGSKAVVELNKVFDWANMSRRGVLLFIDESDAFLRRRKDDRNLSEGLRNSINTFLYRTGNQSNKIMFILATNEPHFLDHAVQNRIDEIFLFDNLSIVEIENILRYHSKTYWKDKDSYDIFTSQIASIAKELNGFSGREVIKFVVTLYDEMMVTDNKALTSEIINEVIIKMKKQKDIKLEWNRLSIYNIDNQYKH